MSFLDQYEPVAERLAKFWADHPDGRVLTALIQSDPVILFRADVYRDPQDERPYASGFAHQQVHTEPPARGGENSPEWTSPFEVCETSAVGRALANANYATKDPAKRPSREEMAAAGQNQAARSSGGALKGNATEAQKKKLGVELRRLGGELSPAAMEAGFTNLGDADTKQKASQLIDLLMAEETPKPAERRSSMREEPEYIPGPDEEPF